VSTAVDVRAQAARVVSEVAARGRSLDAALEPYKGRESGLLRVLATGTVRWHIRLSAFLDQLAARPAAELAPELRSLALVGLFQLLHTDIAAHAAVAETVEATRLLGHRRAVGFVNAILRRCQREAAAIAVEIDRDTALRTAHPRWLVDALGRDWGQDLETLLAANNEHPPMWLRVNRLRLPTDVYVDLLAEAGMDAVRHPFAPEAVQLAVPVAVEQLPGFAKGDVSVQDAAAQLAAHLLAPRAGHRVLDACAAPGGKACHLLELCPGLEELVALDLSASRLARVRQNLTRLGLEASLVTGDAAVPSEWDDGRGYDRILLDVPCSATGVIRRHPDIKLLRREADLEPLCRSQRSLLDATWKLLRPGGRLLYATCSVLQRENAGIVADFLAAQPEAADVTSAASGPLGLPTRRGPGYGLRTGETGADGFYYACLEKA